MNIIETFKIAIESIMSNKMRSFLTMLGIIIGISSVITIVSLGKGGQNSITGEFEKIGASNFTLSVDTTKAQSSEYITMEDIKNIKQKVDSVKYITPVVQKRGSAFSDNKSFTANIVGGNADYAAVNNIEIVSGRFYNDNEVEEGKSLVVIDEDSAKSIFGNTDVIGKSFKIGSDTTSKKVTVIGVTKASLRGPMQKDKPITAYVPVTFLSDLYSDNFKINTVSITAVNKDDLDSPGNGAKIILENRHGNKGKDIYTTTSIFAQLDQINNVLNIVTEFIAAVAAISLIVGGIGVMNIMLVSVTERTREIGIRKAIGATTNAILLQFLTESVIISLIGGIIGMLFGIGGAYIIGVFAKITPSLSPAAVIGAILFSSAVGIFFGIYPAKKAANLNPIDALRYE